MRLFFALVLLSLSTYSQAQLTKDQYIKLETVLGDQSFFSGHVSGFMLYDLDSQRVVFEKDSQLHFIPASTTKLFTLFASLVVLGDSTQTLRYVTDGNTIRIWGSGDPSWKYKKLYQPDFQRLLSPYSEVVFSDANLKSAPFGYGWQWDDYYYNYSAERSSLPIYGNLVEVKRTANQITLSPDYFKNSVRISQKKIKEVERDFHSNQFMYNPSTFIGGEKFIPFLNSPELFVELASAATQKKWVYRPDSLPRLHKEWRGAPLLPLLKEMMLESDNFLAEQLLFMVSDRLFQEIDSERAINYILKTYLGDLPDRSQWVDGSGLSRHNLFTPRVMVALMEKLYRMMPDQELFQLLPIGGQTGTLKNSYQAAQPYIYAKTGTMSNNHSLVGLVRTKSGKMYCFSFMNSNYPHKASVVRREMEKVMVTVRDIF